MTATARIRLPKGNPFRDTTGNWVREADQITLPRLDEVGGHPRPAGVGVTYTEQEYAALADEQELNWPAEGEHEARDVQVQARGWDSLAVATEFLLTESEKQVRAARGDQQHAAQVLTPYVRREPWAKLRYWVLWPLFALGDASSVLSAAIMLGDVPWVAAGQALSAGLAAACAGLVGAELKHRQTAQSRQRDPDTLTNDERRYQRLFTDGTKGIGIVKLIGLLSLLVVALLGVGIFTLRSSVEGSASGLTFGLLAAATAIGSGLRAAFQPSTLLPADLVGMAPGTPAPSPSTSYRLGHPGRPARVPTIVIAICDDSGSVTSPIGADPLSNRYAEVMHAFSVVARRGSGHELGAALHFDTPTSGDTGPVPITRRGLRLLRLGLRVPPDAAGTSRLAPSLQRAVEIADSYPDHKVILLVLSDFWLMDREPGQVLSNLAAFPGQVHAVVLGAGLPAGVLDDRISVTPVMQDDPLAVPA